MSLGTVAAVVGIAGTAYSAYQSSQMAGSAAKDPFGTSNRQHYQKSLRTLTDHPGEVFRDPAFMASLDLGLGGVQRKMAAMGFTDSGNMAAELMQYGQAFGLDWLSKQETTLGNLAGAQMEPSYGAAVGAQGQATAGYSDAMMQLGGLLGGMDTGGSISSPYQGGAINVGGIAPLTNLYPTGGAVIAPAGG